MGKVIAPIIVFTKNDDEQIEITPSLVIRKITNDEIKMLFDCNVTFEEQLVKTRDGSSSGVSFGFWSDIPKEIISITGLEDIIFPYYMIEANSRDEIEDLIFALRMIDNRTVIAPKSIQFLEKGMTCSYFRPYNMNNQKLFNLKSYILTLDSKNIEELIRIFNLVHNTQNKNSKLLRTRLNICIDCDQNNFLCFIESVSIIESIICGNDNGELSFRFSLFSSFLLKKHGFDISSNEMKKFYNIRSTLVHTGENKGYSEDKLIDILNYAKIIYLEYLENDISGDKILHEIEDIVSKVEKIQSTFEVVRLK